MHESDGDRDDAQQNKQRETIPYEQYQHMSRAMDELGKIDDRELPDDVDRFIEDVYFKLDSLYDLVEDDPEVPA